MHFKTHVHCRPTHALSLLCAVALCVASGCESTPSTPEESRRNTVTIPYDITESQNDRFLDAVEMAHEAYEAKDPKEAQNKYLEAITTYSEIPAAWNNVGVLQMAELDYLSASDSFTLAASLSPTDPRPHYNHALLWDRRAYVREALLLYNRSLERDENFLPAIRGIIRAQALLNEGDERTLSLIKRALLLEKDRKWINWLKRQRIRVDALVSAQGETVP